MKASELLGQAIAGDGAATYELGRLLDSLMRLAGEGTRATRSELGLVRLANDGENSGGDMAVRDNDSRLGIDTVSLEDEDGEAIEADNPLPVTVQGLYDLVEEQNNLLKLILLVVAQAYEIDLDPLKDVEP